MRRSSSGSPRRSRRRSSRSSCGTASRPRRPAIPCPRPRRPSPSTSPRGGWRSADGTGSSGTGSPCVPAGITHASPDVTASLPPEAASTGGSPTPSSCGRRAWTARVGSSRPLSGWR
ncbi:hypothetical protein E1264_04880 [Actinomadura sp. KC216]|nr:hypothetical protein E1264_04880 [Actinomadura sp. KC216]